MMLTTLLFGAASALPPFATFFGFSAFFFSSISFSRLVWIGSLAIFGDQCANFCLISFWTGGGEVGVGFVLDILEVALFRPHLISEPEGPKNNAFVTGFKDDGTLSTAHHGSAEQTKGRSGLRQKPIGDHLVQ
ncbi:hypothetical protein ACVMB2_007014 [Sinorhizobium meliloti]